MNIETHPGYQPEKFRTKKTAEEEEQEPLLDIEIEDEDHPPPLEGEVEPEPEPEYSDREMIMEIDESGRPVRVPRHEAYTKALEKVQRQATIRRVTEEMGLTQRTTKKTPEKFLAAIESNIQQTLAQIAALDEAKPRGFGIFWRPLESYRMAGRRRALEEQYKKLLQKRKVAEGAQTRKR